MVEFNIIVTVGTTEIDLAPYPGGTSGKVPTGKMRKIYSIVLSNTATTANTLTIKIYSDGTVEASMLLAIPPSSTISVVGSKQNPILIVPGGRTVKAVASSENVQVVMTGVDE
jgi:hypothetical protein